MNHSADKSEQWSSTYKIDDGRILFAFFTDINDKDGFEISLGMYRANLGPITEEVFRRFVGKFSGVVQEPSE